MNRKNYHTAKGTELPILNLRGKEYLEVKYRLVWFREEHPGWSIFTEIMFRDEKSACMKATIKDENGMIVATSHKVEDTKGFGDFLEKAETGAIGRALALCGYGTQFCADELDEGERIVDAPAQRPSYVKSMPVEEVRRVIASPGDYVCNMGTKYSGHPIKDIPRAEALKILDWLKQRRAPSAESNELAYNIEAYYVSSATKD